MSSMQSKNNYENNKGDVLMKKEIYYYFRDENNRPIVTVCLIKDGDYVRRGVSICSIADGSNKKIGRKIAQGRAMKPVEPGNCSPICSDKAWESLMFQLSDVYFDCPLPFKYKSSMITMDELTPFEYKLVEKACAV